MGDDDVLRALRTGDEDAFATVYRDVQPRLLRYLATMVGADDAEKCLSLAQRTSGKAYWAKTWQKQVEAFDQIREDLGNSYTVTYYPAANPNEGFRKIAIQVVGDTGKKYRVQARPGYRPRTY